MRRFLVCFIAGACLSLIDPVASGAAPISITVTDPALETELTAVFEGTVTNDTDAPIHTADIFLNFFGFDFTAIASIDQLLGITDVVIDAGTTSTVLSLFSVTLDASAEVGTDYAINGFAQDIDDNLSDAFAVTISRSDEVPPTAVPEPATVQLMLTALFAAVVCGARKQSCTKRRMMASTCS